jgi:uncharacterized protein (DUF1697 family)
MGRQISPRTHVALLRGVNVGGHNRVPMAELREIAAALGHTAVATYVNSGNLVFATGRTDTAGLAVDLEQAIEARLGLRIDVVVLSRAELAAVVAGNPFGDPDDPKHLHAVVCQGPLPAQEHALGHDRAVVVGNVLYLHTPDGLGRSVLAARLSRGAQAGTARNWSTVTMLLALLDEAT